MAVQIQVVWSVTHWNLNKMAAIFADNIFKYILLNEKYFIYDVISLKFIP